MGDICNIYNIQDESLADLKFFYSIDLGDMNILFKSSTLTNKVSERPLFSDQELTNNIGYMIFNSIQNGHSNKNTYSVVIRDIKGLTNKGSFEAIHTNENLYPPKPIEPAPLINGFINPNYTLIANIYAGCYNFLDSDGFMVIKTNETSVREVFVYFNKCK